MFNPFTKRMLLQFHTRTCICFKKSYCTILANYNIPPYVTKLRDFTMCLFNTLKHFAPLWNLQANNDLICIRVHINIIIMHCNLCICMHLHAFAYFCMLLHIFACF